MSHWFADILRANEEEEVVVLVDHHGTIDHSPFVFPQHILKLFWLLLLLFLQTQNHRISPNLPLDVRFPLACCLWQNSCPPQDVQPVLLLMLLMHNISVQILKLPCIMINDQKTGRTEDTRDEISSRGPKILFFKPRILSQSLLLCGGGHPMSRGGIQ